MREEETCPHQIADGLYHGTASVIAEQVVRERPSYYWLKLPYDGPSQPPVSSEEMLEWLAICGHFSTEQITDAQLKLPASKELVEPQVFSAAVANESNAREDLQKLEAIRNHRVYGAIHAMPPERRIALGHALRKIEEQRLALMRIAGNW